MRSLAHCSRLQVVLSMELTKMTEGKETTPVFVQSYFVHVVKGACVQGEAE
jgi:hypothetical protein